METIIAAYGVGPITGIIATIVVLNIGIAGFIIKGVGCLSKILGRIDKVENRVETLHEGCHIPIGTMKIVQADIKKLQSKDNDMNLELKGMNIKLSNVESMTTAMYNHFFERGIKSGRRTEDKD